MGKYYLKKTNDKRFKKWLRLLSLGLFISGFSVASYIFFPLISWQIYFAPVFASQIITSPIPKTTIVNPSTIESLLAQAGNTISGVDYTNADNWFPTLPKQNRKGKYKLSSYTLSIPNIGIQNAVVSTVDIDLSRHLIQYEGTNIPGDNGNAVIFGHSTLPQLFKQNDYKTIFANAYKLKVGDAIYATVNSASYLYKVYNITVVDPSDTSIFSQSYDNSYITIVTCTPPGTTWKRLIVRARFEKI